MSINDEIKNPKHKIIFKELLKEYWEDYKWTFYLILTGFLCVWSYAIFKIII